MKTASTFSVYKLVLSFLFSTFCASAQEPHLVSKIIGKLATYVELTSPDKVYLQTDKDFYSNSETIWFKTYVVDGVMHFKSNKSKVVYVELLDARDSIIAQRKIYAAPDWAAGDIALPENIEEGVYLLRAYTKYMLNDDEPVFFQKEIPIWQKQVNANEVSKNETKDEKQNGAPTNQNFPGKSIKPLVRFFPEGGHLVSGLKNGMGLKITDIKGNGIALRGDIVDGNGTKIVPFRSFEFGLASAHFEVEGDTDYYAQIEVNGVLEKYPLPKALTKGYTLQLTNHGEHLVVRLATNIHKGLEGTLLLGHLRGSLIFKDFVENSTDGSYEKRLSTHQLDDGVAHFTLFAPSGEPLCERLTFIENPRNKVALFVETDKADYGFREQVSLSLALQDRKSRPLEGRFSMSVASENSLKKKTATLKSWLLLNSDLGGTVEDPDYFFEDDSKARNYVLDLLMLTHGWRRFVWKAFSEEGVSPELTFPPERGIMINGITTDFDNRHQPFRTVATLNILAQSIRQEKMITDTQGKFSFGPFLFKDSVEIILKAKVVASDTKNKKVSVNIDPSFPTLTVKRLRRRQTNTVTTGYVLPYLKEVQRKKLNDFKYDPQVTQLDEVVVKKKIKTRKEIINETLNERTLYGEARNRVIPDSIPFAATNSVFDLLVTVPGVQVAGFSPNQAAKIQGNLVPPLYLLDGAQVGSNFVQNIPLIEVLFVDVLKGPEASIYGTRGSGGVIAIYTKKGENFGENPKDYPGIANFTISGFYKAKEFYSPNYAVADPKHDKQDYRITLDWVPEINIEQNQKTELNFYTGDTSGTYEIRIEGITQDGRPVSAVHSFNVVDNESR